MVKDYKTVEDLEWVSWEEFWRELWEDYDKIMKVFYTKSAEVTAKLRDWTDKELNSVVHNLFQSEQHLFWWNIKNFTTYLISGINEYIDFIEFSKTAERKSEEYKTKDRKTTDFEEKYHAVLYFW